MKNFKRRKPIKVSIPAKVAYDLDSFQKGLKDLLGELGCMACCSGYDITFQTQQGPFFVGKDLEVSSIQDLATRRGGVIHEHGHHSVSTASNPLVVGLHEKVEYDIEKITNVVAQIAENLGHPQCVSGLDILLQSQLDLVVNERGNVIR